jgi:serine/threonine-protein kinase RsbW
MAVQPAGPEQEPDDAPRGPAAFASAMFSRSLPATTDNVGALRRAVGEFAVLHGATPTALDDLNVAVSEALTNVVVHAYRDATAPGPLIVVATVHDHALDVTVADEGCGMTPRLDSPGLGLGLGLIAKLAETFDITPRGGPGVVVRMRFALAG